MADTDSNPPAAQGTNESTTPQAPSVLADGYAFNIPGPQGVAYCINRDSPEGRAYERLGNDAEREVFLKEHYTFTVKEGQRIERNGSH